MLTTRVAFATLLLATLPASAGQRIANGGALWCEHYPQLGPFAAAFLAHGAIAYDEFPTCARINSGVAVDILDDAPPIAGNRVVAVRVHGNGATVDGFTFAVSVGP